MQRHLCRFAVLSGPFVRGVWPVHASSFEGHHGYADLLYSFTRQHLLLRDGTVRETKDFLSSKTLYVMVVYVFYAPALGVTTVMQVQAPSLSTPLALP